MRSRILIGVAVIAMVTVGCSDSDEEVATCEALQDLAVSVDDLLTLDVIATGTDGLESTVADLDDAWTEAEAVAGDQFGPPVEALYETVGNAISAVESFSDSASLEAGVTEVSAAFDDVGTAWASLEESASAELDDCDLSASGSQEQ